MDTFLLAQFSCGSHEEPTPTQCSIRGKRKMPHFWDFGKGTPKHRNLQDGLFQIASQTCSLLVQVNNTNNISYGNNSSNIHLNNLSSGTRNRSPGPAPGDKAGDREQLLVLIPPAEKSCKYKPGLLGKPRLSVRYQILYHKLQNTIF